MRRFQPSPSLGSPRRARRRRWIRALLLLGVLSLGPALAGACRENEPDPELPEARTLSDIELGRVGGRVYNEPERVEEILAEADLTPEAFERRVREVTDDPERARQYTLGFESVAQLPERAAEPHSIP